MSTLKYMNQAEDYGTDSYVIKDLAKVRPVRRQQILLIIKMKRIPDGLFEGLVKAKKAYGLDNVPVLPLEYEEAICATLPNPRLDGEKTKLMPFSAASLNRIERLLPEHL